MKALARRQSRQLDYMLGDLEKMQRRPKPALQSISFIDFRTTHLAHYQKVTDSTFHADAERELNVFHKTRGQKICRLAPRGSAKSSVYTVAYASYCAAEGLEKYILVVSDTQPQTLEHMANIRKEFELGSICDDYGLTVVKSNAHEIELSNGCRIRGWSTGQSTRGIRERQDRPSLIIVDDPQSDKHIHSEEQREKDWNWFSRALMEQGDPFTNFIVLGTAIHEECIVQKTKKTPGWSNRVYRAMVSMPANLGLWYQWKDILCDWTNENKEADAEEYYEKNKTAMDKGAVPLWPEWEDTYPLMLKWAANEDAFRAEKQNEPINVGAMVFRPEWLVPDEGVRKELMFKDWPDDIAVKVLALDPSTGRADKVGDLAAFAMVGMTMKKLFYVEHVCGRMTDDVIVSTGLDLIQAFQPQKFFIEANACQRLYAPMFIAGAQKRQMLFPCELDLRDSTEPKAMRIRRLVPLHSLNRMRFRARSPGTLEALSQKRNYTGDKKDRDDCIDAEEMGCRLCARLFDQLYGRRAA